MVNVIVINSSLIKFNPFKIQKNKANKFSARGNPQDFLENHGRVKDFKVWRRAKLRFLQRFGGPLHFNAKTLRKGKNFASRISFYFKAKSHQPHFGPNAGS